MSNSYSIWVKLDRYPPVLVRLLATNPSDRTQLLTDEQIRARSQGTLTLSDIKSLSYAPTWENVPVGTMRRFCLACGVDFAHRPTMRRLNRYLKTRPRFRHLTRDPNYPEYRTMLKEYYEFERRGVSR